MYDMQTIRKTQTITIKVKEKETEKFSGRFLVYVVEPQI